MPFTILRNDITMMSVDAIVNAANTDLLMGGGVCGAIFNAAGAEQLQVACNKLAPIKTGEAVMTPGFNLLAKHVIHTVGPIYSQWSEQESRKLLHSAYTNALRLATENGCESIAFPLISSGIYGHPKSEALKVATEAIRAFLKGQDLEVYLVVFDKSALSVSEELLGEVASYIDDHYVDLKSYDTRSSFLEAQDRNLLMEEDLYSGKESPPPPPTYLEPSKDSEYPKRPSKTTDRLPYPESFQAPCQSIERSMPVGMPQEKKAKSAFSLWEPKIKKKKIKKEDSEEKLDDLIRSLDEPFSQTLLRLIDAKGMTDVEVYKAANIDRKLFSKIRVGRGYTPSKKTILALAIALQLSLEETHRLLAQAGYALSRSQIFDVIVEYFISKKRYDIFEINEVLFSYDQQLLGS